MRFVKKKNHIRDIIFYKGGDNTLIMTEILKSLRLEADLTQSQLAQKLGIGQSTIVGYERGDREPTASNLMKYASYFNVSMDFLTGGNENDGKSKNGNVMRSDK